MTSTDVALTGWQVRYEQRSFWRNRRAAFFSLVFPLMYLLVFGTLTHDAHLDSRGGLSMIDFYVPGIVTYAIVLIGFNTTALSFAHRRANGVFKRIRATPLPWPAYVAGALGSTFLVIVLSVALMLAIGVGLFGAHARAGTLPGLVLTLLVGTVCFTLLGVAASRLVPKPESGMGILMVITLPLTFISNIWFPIDDAPAWVRDLAGAFPLKPLADGVATAFDPSSAAPGIAWHDLLVLGLWTVAGCAMMAGTLRSITRRA